MPQKPKRSIETDEFYQQRSRLWHDGLWALRGGRPASITIYELRNKATVYDVPADVVIDCLRTFSDEGLIRCRSNDDTVINNPFKESDFERFGFTYEGSNRGPNY